MPNFKEEFVHKPEFYLNCFSLAIHNFILKKFTDLYEQFRCEKMSSSSMPSVNESIIDIDYQKELASFETTNEIPTIKARILNYHPRTKIKNLKANMFEKFVSIVGTVVRVSNSKPFVKRLAFECNKCSSTFVRQKKNFQYF